MKLSDKRKKQIIKESMEQDEFQTVSDRKREVRDRIKQINANAKKEDAGPGDFYLLLDPDAFDDMESVDDLEAELRAANERDRDKTFRRDRYRDLDDDMPASWDDDAEEEYEEWFAKSLYTHAGQDVEDVEDLPVKEPVASAEEKKLESLPMHSSMGRSMKRNRIRQENKPFGLKEVMSSYMKECQHLNECGCQMKSPFDAPEDEPQGYMLVQNLDKLAKKAAELAAIAKYTDDAEPWVESKINSAAEHLDAVYDYIKYGRNKKSDMHDEMEHHEEYEEQY